MIWKIKNKGRKSSVSKCVLVAYVEYRKLRRRRSWICQELTHFSQHFQMTLNNVNIKLFTIGCKKKNIQDDEGTQGMAIMTLMFNRKCLLPFVKGEANINSREICCWVVKSRKRVGTQCCCMEQKKSSFKSEWVSKRERRKESCHDLLGWREIYTHQIMIYFLWNIYFDYECGEGWRRRAKETAEKSRRNWFI